MAVVVAYLELRKPIKTNKKRKTHQTQTHIADNILLEKKILFLGGNQYWMKMFQLIYLFRYVNDNGLNLQSTSI